MPANAITSASSVERGRWKFVSSASTRRNSKPGVMKSSVRPLQRAAAGERLERARRRRADGEHALGGARSAPTRPARPRSARRGSVLLERRLGHGPERVEADVQRHALDVELREQLGREVQAGGRRGRGAGVARVDRLVARGVGERRGDVRRQRRLAVRLAVEPQRASAPRRDARAARRRRSVARPSAAASAARAPSQTSPSMRSSSSTSPRGDSIGIRAGTTRVSLTTTSSPCSSSRQLGEARGAAPSPRRPLVDEEPRRVPPLGRMLRDQLRRQLVVQLGRRPSGHRNDVSHVVARVGRRSRSPRRTRPSPPWTKRSSARSSAQRLARDRGSTRRSSARATRSRRSPRRPPSSRRRCRPASATRCRTACARRSSRSRRHLAEVRGLMNQLIRRLERVEGDLLAERHARVDDLALLVDLVASGWRGVDAAPHRREHREAARRDGTACRAPVRASLRSQTG